jgi:signal transduction histidine kinase
MSNWMNWRDGLLLAAIVGAVVAGAMLWRVRSRGLAQPGSQTVKPTPAPPWTAVLVLMPVLALALVGLVSVIRDRATVEEEAQKDAARWARNLAAQLQVSWPLWLGTLELHFGKLTNDDRFEWRSTDPIEVGSLRSPNRPSLEDFQVMPSGEHTLPVLVRATPRGLLHPPGYPTVPQPPSWVSKLSPRVQAALERLQDPQPLPTQDVETELRAVMAGSRDLSVGHWARFLALRRAPPGDLDAPSQLLGLGLSALSNRVESVTGLPLGALSFEEYGRRSGVHALGDLEFELLRGLTLVQPSLMTQGLLEMAYMMTEGLSSTTPSDLNLERRGKMVLSWRRDELSRELFRCWNTSHDDSGEPLRKGWMDCGKLSWWGFKEEIEADEQFQVTFYSADALSWVAGMALKGHAWEWDSRGHPRQLLPVGWSYSVELEGRSLTHPVLPESSKFPVLASEAGTFSGVRWHLKTDQFKVLPESEHPKFVLRIHLQDPEIVFAAQRRRQWLFGGLILAAAAVAGLAAWQMQRSIHRQQALNEEQSNFIASVSHELRIPLATLRLLAEGLASGRVAEPNQRRQYAGLLLQETRRLGRLVENVLDFGRIEQGRKEYQFEPTDLVRLVSATVRAFEPLAAERKVRIAWTEPVDSQFAGRSEAVVELLADGVALQQALSNLLDNALKHAPEGSVVTVAVEAVGSPSGDLASVSTRLPSVVRISVRDAGPGIPPEDRQRIFERFFRRGSELRRETQGVGLGLAIVRHIVSAHRGRVWVDDTPGPGACFVMELPCGEFSDGQSNPAEASPSPRPIHASDIASDANPGSDPEPLSFSALKAEPRNPDSIL